MDNDILNSKYGKSFLLYTKSSYLNVGSHCKDFTANTLTGETISIAELLKKENLYFYIWRVRVYARVRKKNFKDDIEILAFVFARNKNEWIYDSKYPLDITLLSDMKGGHSSIKIHYDVQATPTVFIINDDGAIIWKSIDYKNNVNDATKKLFNE